MANKINEEMPAHVKNWMQSGMSIKAYAETIGISNGKLAYWARKLKNVKGTQGDPPGFIELCTSGYAPEVSQPAQTGNSPTPQIVLTFPNGMCLKIYG